MIAPPLSEVLERDNNKHKIRLRPYHIVGDQCEFILPSLSINSRYGTLDRILIPDATKLKRAFLTCEGGTVFDLDLATGQFPCRVPIGILNHTSTYLITRGQVLDYIDFEGTEFPDTGELVEMGTFMPVSFPMPDLYMSIPEMTIELHEFVLPNGKKYKHTLLVREGSIFKKYTVDIDIPSKA